MNKEDYVSFEVAKLMKEKGFNEPCFSQYTKTGSIWNYQAPENFNESEGCYSRPSLYEAQKWLRNHFNTYVGVDSSYKKKGKLFSFTIDHYDNENYWEWGWQPEADNYYNEYEEALNRGIKEALKMI